MVGKLELSSEVGESVECRCNNTFACVVKCKTVAWLGEPVSAKSAPFGPGIKEGRLSKLQLVFKWGSLISRTLSDRVMCDGADVVSLLTFLVCESKDV